MMKNEILSKDEHVDSSLYQYPPHVSKPLWTKLGNAICKREKIGEYNVPGDKWMTLRLDGSGFSKLLKVLTKKGIFNQGYSEEFGNIQKKCITALMKKVNAKFGYTQSDEMTVIIRPAKI
mmetsp:Transcript_64222/g.54423  ORF Transcript_64222/g.54423 Transcript_64222/m.54423 type:complete len:120 (-) Transcript_64222:604-963(-)